VGTGSSQPSLKPREEGRDGLRRSSQEKNHHRSTPYTEIQSKPPWIRRDLPSYGKQSKKTRHAREGSSPEAAMMAGSKEGAVQERRSRPGAPEALVAAKRSTGVRGK
jgi:hypothetical protein